MSEVILELRLYGHCIATEAKRAYERSLSQYFRSPGSLELEERIELLRKVLEGVDLPALRAAHPELQGGQGVVVRLRQRGNLVSLEMEGRTIHTVSIPD